MSDVQRYDPQNPLDRNARPVAMYPAKHGGYVRFEDYERLAAELPEIPAWTEKAPTEQGYYWWWNGNPDDTPYGCYVMLSGSNGKCFVQAKDMARAPWCDSLDGWWRKIPVPSVPALEVDR